MSVLIVAFDGMDKNLIEEYDCQNIRQEEYGSINIKNDVSSIITSELFATFITGTNYKDHGIINKKKYDNRLIDWIEDFNRYRWFRKFIGLRKKIYKWTPFLKPQSRGYNKRDLDIPTIFDEIEDSVDIRVASYSIGYSFAPGTVMQRYGIEEGEKERQRAMRYLKTDLEVAIEEHHDLVMCHFREPDTVHHWYWEVGKMEKVEQTYHQLDDLAAEIKEKAKENGYDTIIFMSDHGLPDVESGDGHNENAFYSCNHELFPDRTPHITDFHDKILELAGQDDETAGIDV